MLFADYTFDVLPNGTIIFDRELTTSDLNIKEGDVYEVQISGSGRVVFSKKTLADES